MLLRKANDDSSTEVKLRAANERINAMQIRLRQQEEEYRDKEKHYTSAIAELRHMEEMCRELCMVVLSKDRGEMRLGSDYTWNKVPTEDLIQKTTSSYKQYCKDRSQAMQALKDLAMDKTIQLVSADLEVQKLQDINKDLRARSASSPDLTFEQKKEAVMKSGGIAYAKKIDQALNRINPAISLAPEYSDPSLNIEYDDEDMEGVSEITYKSQKAAQDAKTESFTQHQNVQAMTMPPEEKARRLTQEEKIIQQVPDSLKPILDSMSEIEWEYLRIVGSTGKSIGTDIRNMIDLDKTETKSQARAAETALLNSKQLLHGQRVSALRKGWVVSLSQAGKQAYYDKFKTFPVESEYVRITANHANIEHGYGILSCYRLLRESKRYTKLSMYNKGKGFTDKRLPDGVTYEPDIIGTIVDKNETDPNKAIYVEFFEYERARQTQTEYINKFDKMSLFTDGINVIAQSASSVVEMQRYLFVWCNKRKKDPDNAKKIIRITTFEILKKAIGEGRSFPEWWKVVSAVEDLNPPNVPV